MASSIVFMNDDSFTKSNILDRKDRIVYFEHVNVSNITREKPGVQCQAVLTSKNCYKLQNY